MEATLNLVMAGLNADGGVLLLLKAPDANVSACLNEDDEEMSRAAVSSLRLLADNIEARIATKDYSRSFTSHPIP
jgi:hypothetical protein